jgi:hypothetical protein
LNLFGIHICADEIQQVLFFLQHVGIDVLRLVSFPFRRKPACRTNRNGSPSQGAEADCATASASASCP